MSRDTPTGFASDEVATLLQRSDIMQCRFSKRYLVGEAFLAHPRLTPRGRRFPGPNTPQEGYCYPHYLQGPQE